MLGQASRQIAGQCFIFLKCRISNAGRHNNLHTFKSKKSVPHHSGVGLRVYSLGWAVNWPRTWNGIRGYSYIGCYVGMYGAEIQLPYQGEHLGLNEISFSNAAAACLNSRPRHGPGTFFSPEGRHTGLTPKP